MLFGAATFYPNMAFASFKTGNDLLAECKEASGVDFGECLGYVLGAADAMEGPTIYTTKIRNGAIAQRPRACFRDEVTAGQLRDIVVKWLEDHPQIRDMSASACVEAALSAAFPC